MRARSRADALPLPRSAAPSAMSLTRVSSARHLALGGLAVAPLGLGGLADCLAPLLWAPRRQTLSDSLAVHLGIARGDGLPLGFAPPPSGLVCVRHRVLLSGSALAPQ